MNAHSPLQANDPWAWIWSLGYRAIVPITPHDAQLKPGIDFNPKSRGKAPGIRTSEGWTGLSGWPTHYPTESQTEAYRDMGAGIGIRCEKGLLGIDVDTLIEEHAERIRTIVDSRLGPLPLRIGQAPKFLLFCRTEPGYKHPNITFDGGEIEVRTSMQFVAVGTHPATLQPYRWLRDLPPHTDLAFVKPEILDALWIDLRDALPKGRFTSSIGEAAEVADQDSLRGTLRDVERAVALIPNDYASRKVYLRMGYALRAALPDNLEEARRIFQDWCARWDDPRGNDPETVDKDFNSFNGRRKVGIGWLRDEADLRTGGRFTAEKFNERIKPSGIDPTPYSFPDPSTIPVRSSLYAGHYMRKFLSATIAQSKVGKSTLVLAEALAMASGKPLLGVQPSGKFRVWWWNGEDPHEELERRVAAAMKFYKLTRDDIEDRLLINSGREMPIVLATQGPKGIIVESKTVDALCEAILKKQIDVFIGDPFVSLHKVSENDNIAIDTVGKTCALVAERTNIAFDAVHHSRKLNGMNALVEDGRGASALLGATRSMRALSKMSKEEGRELGVGTIWKSLFRFSDVSSNMSPPSDDDEKWLRIVSVNLENGEGDDLDRITKGDHVGVATLFNVSEAQEYVAKEEAATAPPDAESTALAALGAHQWRKDTRAANWAGVPIARAFGFDLDTDEGKSAAKSTLKKWLRERKIEEFEIEDTHRHPKTHIRPVMPTIKDDLFS